jgi:putative DNA primase/helicase
LKRLLSNKRFTDCTAIDETLKQYRTESDSVQMFIDENNYQASSTECVPLKELYQQYRAFCCGDGYRTCSNRTFAERLWTKRFYIRKTMGNKVVEIEKAIEYSKNECPY